MSISKTTSFALCLFLTPLPALADWSEKSEKVHAPVEPENRIIKWCEDGGEKVRFASANIRLKGYSPCGKIAAQSSCDAVGNKFIGKGNVPYDYRDCKRGPRISIERSIDTPPPPSTPDTSVASSVPQGPMSTSETEQLKKEVKTIIDQQPGREIDQAGFQKLLMQNMNLLGQAMDKSNSSSRERRKRRSRNRRSSRQNEQIREAKQLMKTLSPESKQLLEQFFGREQLKQLLNQR